MARTTQSKKRKASSAPDTPVKKVRIGSATNIPNPPATSPSGRPKRASVGDPTYNYTRRRSSSTQNPSPVTKSESAPKKRGRPPKKVASPAIARARPRKTPNTASPKQEEEATPKKRGRPRKTLIAASPKQEEEATPKDRGRPRKNDTTTKAENTTSVGKSAPTAVNTEDRPRAKRGRKPKASLKVIGSMREHGIDSEDLLALDVNAGGGALEDFSTIDTDVQYWLMKAEPDSRIEKGHDMKFSIDDLATKTEPEAWDGVRNPAARNNMRAMRKGDLAFFYHSSCTVPGVVGVMRIVAEHSIDESAFDPNHPYFDPKSDRSKPRWEVVYVEFVRKFENSISLRELKSFAGPGGALENMQTLKQSRLSVSSVSPEEWRFILDLAGESLTLGHGDGTSGYESQVDGEGEEMAGATDAEGINVLSDDGLSLGAAGNNGLEGPLAHEDVNGTDAGFGYMAGN